MSLYRSVLRPILFSLDAESAHNLGMAVLERGLVPDQSLATPELAVDVFGIKFPNPIGLAAGLDKNGVAVDIWHRLGFGFAEIGTVTWHAQPGNPKPRLFRLPADQAVINRMGFNNEGAEAMARRLEKASPKIPLGINLGKSKITELPDAAEDYRKSFQLLRSFGDYFVVNVSSPNTPGLRSLQEKGPLKEILMGLKEIDSQIPLLVKIAPDLTLEMLDDVAEVVLETKLAGVIATNTTLSREGLTTKIDEAGGLSGVPVREKSNLILGELKQRLPDLPIIGVGGIFTADDVLEKQRLGAELVQLYTGWIYGGPSLVPEILRELSARNESRSRTVSTMETESQ